MARPSMNKERKEQILSAYERCIARYGIAGATLKTIAAEAGLARPLVRHHVGNQDQLLAEAFDRFIHRTEENLETMPAGSFTDIEAFAAFLFDKTYSDSQQNDILIASAFMMEAANNATIQQALQGWMQKIQDWFEAHLSALFPDVSAKQISTISTGIIGIYFNVEALTPLGDIKTLREQSRQAALLLLRALQLASKG